MVVMYSELGPEMLLLNLFLHVTQFLSLSVYPNGGGRRCMLQDREVERRIKTRPTHHPSVLQGVTTFLLSFPLWPTPLPLPLSPVPSPTG